MKHKKLLTVFISVVFVLIVGFAAFTLFTVKNVGVSFSIYGVSSYRSESVTQKLKTLKGKNIVAVSEKKTRDMLKDDTYFELVSFKKKFPDKIEITLKERRAGYYVVYGENYYIISQEGFVLEKTDVLPDKELVKISVTDKDKNGYVFGEPVVGGYFCYSDNPGKDISAKITAELLTLCGQVDILGCINEVGIFSTSSVTEICFYTKTSVVLDLFDVYNDGKNKLTALTEAYNQSDDFAKAEYTITLGEKDENGKYTVIWSPAGSEA